MKEEIVKDIITFYKTIGELDGISERQLIDLSELNTIDHATYLHKLTNKYDINMELKGNLEDDILKMESEIDEKFKNILLKV